MDERATELIRKLALEPHPEGGYFGEIYRSPREVAPMDDRPERSALTTIYFLLLPESPSTWHRLRSDEIWHYCEGAPAELLTVDPEFDELTPRILGPLSDEAEPARVVPTGYWQAARTTGSFSLVGCTIGPGFEYEDFKLMRDDPDAAERLRKTHPKGMDLI
jgi:predicted cupin superfamily sugar epimerase